jgi:hypothetical protein
MSGVTVRHDLGTIGSNDGRLLWRGQRINASVKRKQLVYRPRPTIELVIGTLGRPVKGRLDGRPIFGIALERLRTAACAI